MKTFELSLPDELHRRIRRIAKDEAKPAKDIVRHAIAVGLAVRDRRKRHRAILAYARRMASTPHDLDTELESAGIDCLQTSMDDSQ